MLPDNSDAEITVSEFVALCNQAFDYVFPSIVITGELANLRVSKGKWVYFDLKDEECTVKFFGTVYMLPGPLEDGMMLKVRGQPRLHKQYGFSVNVMTIQPAGEGTIKRAAKLLEAKLQKEGLFDESRKRPLPYPPSKIGLITSKQSAAYADFVKIINARWQGVEIQLIDVQVQGEVAPTQIVAAIEQFNSEAEVPEVLILIRGGGSPEDLAAFSTESVTRAVAASRVPTLVAIGHEIDESLAELAADKRASTPSNAAELLVPDRQNVLQHLESGKLSLHDAIARTIRAQKDELKLYAKDIDSLLKTNIQSAKAAIAAKVQVLEALSPEAIMRRGYAVVRLDGKPIRDTAELKKNDIVSVEMTVGKFEAEVMSLTDKKAK